MAVATTYLSLPRWDKRKFGFGFQAVEALSNSRFTIALTSSQSLIFYIPLTKLKGLKQWALMLLRLEAFFKTL